MSKPAPSLKVILVVGLLLVAGIYAYFRVKDFVTGPVIKVNNPQDGQTFENKVAQISGRAERISYLYLNGRQIFTDEEGRFSEDLLLLGGYNIIELKANDRFGRTVIKNLHLVLTDG